VFGEGTLRAVSDLCRERGLYHIADEVYEYFTFDAARHVSAAAFPGAADYTITMFSLSKAYGFAGVAHRVHHVSRSLARRDGEEPDTILVCPTVAAQVGAIAALEVGRSYCAPYVAELAGVRNVVVSELDALKPLATVPAADGAFYVLLKVETDRSPMRIAEQLIREHRVAVIPGPAFGMSDGCYFRVAYGALQKDTVAEGIGRLVTGLRKILS
jgi:aspartate/methionine/tyrosine aminotransferase